MIGVSLQQAAPSGVIPDILDLRAQPVYDPISQIIYSGHRDQITQVWVGGRRVVRDRALTTLDLADLRHATESWGQRIVAR